jgi:hypothetical protein
MSIKWCGICERITNDGEWCASGNSGQCVNWICDRCQQHERLSLDEAVARSERRREARTGTKARMSR